ncbi:hypothetical protein M8C13_34945 [Crossiella sp. SN42]|uniref:hypothetical protein n=1 Tax=Crossiella sp. SN42 TaxID=2944808 RepID=UPI00207C8D6D|nr:hypothetical protein [Crossiella sp. SN42]MCO1580967.1 hypothetical protein [Crossiella sp. SN42]
MSARVRVAAVALAAGAALAGLPAVAVADTGSYTVSSQNVSNTFWYRWYLDLPAEVHQEGLRYFFNATDVAMCTADWDRGTLYRIQAYAPGSGKQPASSRTDAIVDCRYFLA